MMPDWLFHRVQRIYLAEKRARDRALRERVQAEDRAFRAQCARELAAHQAGMCGGAAAGCGYVPCVPRVSWH